MDVGVALQGHMKDAGGDGNVPKVDCINVISVSISWLSYSFARCYHWGKLSKRYCESSNISKFKKLI